MSRYWIGFALIVMVGLTARLVLAWMLPDDLQSDHDAYMAHALPLSHGLGYVVPSSDRPTAFRPPGYPLMLAGFMACGVSPSASVLLVNILFSAAVIALTMALARRYGVGDWISLLAGAVAAFDPLLVRYAILPMTEVPCAAFLTAALIAFPRNNEAVECRWGRLLACGVLFGLAILVRPTVAVTLALLLIGFVLRKQNNSRKNLWLQHRLFPAMILTFSTTLTLSPWVIRNAVQLRHFIPATTHGGYTLALGNNPEFYRDVIHGRGTFPWDGEALDQWQKRTLTSAAADGVAPGDEVALDAWYYRHALQAIRDDVAGFRRSVLLRLGRFMALTPAERQNKPVGSAIIAGWYSFIWAGILLLAAAHIFRLKSVQSQGPLDLWLVVLSFMLIHSVFWTDTRMRAPVMPVLAVLSVLGWTQMIKRRRRSYDLHHGDS
jgi:4-amino-4-deoxy-L-arabinose transferase-like glycosyltransferase